MGGRRPARGPGQRGARSDDFWAILSAPYASRGTYGGAKTGRFEPFTTLTARALRRGVNIIRFEPFASLSSGAPFGGVKSRCSVSFATLVELAL